MRVVVHGSGSQGSYTELTLSFIHGQEAYLVGAESACIKGRDANITPANCCHGLTHDMLFLPEEVYQLGF